ncbi:MAG TPA: hypothetical protein VGO93_11750, partial [Candidatus Xenobia bacterium]
MAIGFRPDEWVRRFARAEVNGRSVYREQGGEGILVTRGADGDWVELSEPPSQSTLPVDSVRIRRDKPEPRSIAQRILERCRNLQGQVGPSIPDRELYEVFPRDTWITQGHSSRKSEAGRLDTVTLFAEADR